jgi:hypothetical protein
MCQVLQEIAGEDSIEVMRREHTEVMTASNVSLDIWMGELGKLSKDIECVLIGGLDMVDKRAIPSSEIQHRAL